MWMMFVTAIPIVGVIMVLIWAFTGENESRKNYYRAILAWIGIFIALILLLGLLGNWPAIQKQIQTWTHKA
jgi:quinol-cytochrome oxidoreductase complex cytochrome b subunit